MPDRLHILHLLIANRFLHRNFAGHLRTRDDDWRRRCTVRVRGTRICVI